jgi:DHA2 family methylenomycin A resistance protein-like MFS transporter
MDRTIHITRCSSVIEPAKGSVLSKPLTLTAMSLGWGVVQLDVTIVNTALESIGTSLGGGVSQLQWVVSIYTVAFASLIFDGWRFRRSLRC